MEKPRVVWKIFPREVPRVIKQSDYPRGLLSTFFPDKPKAFPLFVRLWGSQTEEYAAEGLHEESPDGGFRLSRGAL